MAQGRWLPDEQSVRKTDAAFIGGICFGLFIVVVVLMAVGVL